MHIAYRIRGAITSDLERVVAIDRAVDTLPHWRMADYLAALASPERRSGIQGHTRVQGNSRCLFVAERKADAVIVGFAVGKATVLEAEALAELESVGVTEQARRKGLGRALCGAVIEWSRRMGASEIELEVRSQSAGSIALYNDLGFVPMGRRARYYRDPVDDAIEMRLDLGSRHAHGPMQGRDL